MAEKDTAADDPLELKKRARRRLVGAVAIALAAIIVLPMVMDSEPRPATQDIQVRIPSQEGDGFVSRVLPGNKPAPLPPLSETKPDADTPPASAPTPPKPTENAAPAPLVVPPHEVKPVAAPPAVKPEVKAELVKPESKSGDRATKPSEAARAAAALEGKSATQWVVQLGAYQNTGNVKLLLNKIKEMNIAAYTEKADTPDGPRIRVRAGPFTSKDAADKAQARIVKIGVKGSVAQK